MPEGSRREPRPVFYVKTLIFYCRSHTDIVACGKSSVLSWSSFGGSKRLNLGLKFKI